MRISGQQALVLLLLMTLMVHAQTNSTSNSTTPDNSTSNITTPDNSTVNATTNATNNTTTPNVTSNATTANSTTNSTPPIVVVGPQSFVTGDCINGCYKNASNNASWYFCSTSFTQGYCCPQNSTDPNCIDNPTGGVACSYNASLIASNAPYAFCPRRTSSCGTAGVTLRPLLNMNQTVVLNFGGSSPSYMDQTKGDVCYWEFFVDPALFSSKHVYAAGHLDQVFINIAIDSIASNVQLSAMQGQGRRNANNTNLTLSTRGMNTQFSLQAGRRVILMAYPTDPTKPQATQLKFTYNISTIYYPVAGLDVQLKAIVAADQVDMTNYWYIVGGAYAVIFIGIMVAWFTICCKDFDPRSDFEDRRRRQTKEAVKGVKDAQKAALKKSKAAPPKKAAPAKKGAKKVVESDNDDEEGGGSDIEKVVPAKKGGAKTPLAKKQTQKGGALEIEKPIPPKFKNDKNKHKDEFKTPLLDQSEDN